MLVWIFSLPQIKHKAFLEPLFVDPNATRLVYSRANCWPLWYQCSFHIYNPYWDTSEFMQQRTSNAKVWPKKLLWLLTLNYCLSCKDRKSTAVEPIYSQLSNDVKHLTPRVFKCNEEGVRVALEHYQIANKTKVYSVLSGDTSTIMQIHGWTAVFVDVNSYSSLFSVTQAVKIPPLRSVYVNRDHKIYRKSAAKNV